MPDRVSFDYAVIRVVPSVERGEFLNAGVVLLCRQRAFLAARMRPDLSGLSVLAPAVCRSRLRAHLDLIRCVCQGDPAAGPIAHLDPAARFHWLVAPSSTVIQASPVHGGVCVDPDETLAALYARLVG